MRMAPCIDAKAKNIYVLVDLFNKETAQIEIIDVVTIPLPPISA